MRFLLSLALVAGVAAANTSNGISAASAAEISKSTAAILKDLGKPANLLDGWSANWRCRTRHSRQ